MAQKQRNNGGPRQTWYNGADQEGRKVGRLEDRYFQPSNPKEEPVRQAIHTDKGAKPLGPYSQGIVAQGRLVFLSGQGPVDPQSGQLVLGDFGAQAELTLTNIGTLLEAAGATWADVVKVTVFIADQANFATFNEVYARFVQKPYPARSTVEACLGQMGLEVDCIAVIQE